MTAAPSATSTAANTAPSTVTSIALAPTANVSAWIADWADQRCGQHNPVASSAWAALLDTVYKCVSACECV